MFSCYFVKQDAENTIQLLQIIDLKANNSLKRIYLLYI